MRSLPSWERGLKSCLDLNKGSGITSLPSWERGLKYYMRLCIRLYLRVAPLVGAWIEIFNTKTSFLMYSGRSPRGSVD